MPQVLIVDDREESRYMLRTLLTGNGYEVESACQGVEALEKARRNPPQLIISDLLMPMMDGYTLLRHWKADDRLKAIPFIVYTATFTEPQDEQLALDLGADAFIVKPAEPEQVMARIQEVLAKTEAGGRPPVRLPQGTETVRLQEYGEVIVRKLEEKTTQLEESNRALREDVARSQEAEAWANQLLAEAERARAAVLRVLEGQRKAEIALQHSQDLLAQAQNMGKTGAWEIDLETGKLTWTEMVYRIHEVDLNYQPTVGLSISFYTPASRPIIERAVQRAIQQGESFDVELEISTAKGNLRSVHAVGKADLAHRTVLGFFQDITSRKQAEESLRKQAAELKARNEELERFNRVTTGRELRMIELKREVNVLCQQSGQSPRYPVDFAEPLKDTAKPEP